ncbi:hypothetical protein BDR03DRAFT_156904 [Suillus americanus]|nr:hypothetical protein BDR03DRAFT_156904 [Suillus americanus]
MLIRRWNYRSLLHYLYHPLCQDRLHIGFIFEIGCPPRSSDASVMQFLRQHLSYLVPRHSHVPPVVEVASGRKVTVTHISLHLSAFCGFVPYDGFLLPISQNTRKSTNPISVWTAGRSAAGY